MLIRRTIPHQKGFTLIELMICVAVVAILAAVALPSYQSHVRKGRRADAQAFMMDVAARQQHWLVDRRAYAAAVVDLGLTPPGNVTDFYSVAMAVVNVAGSPPTFLITATPVGSQANDSCGALKLDEKGTKTQTGTGRCW